MKSKSMIVSLIVLLVVLVGCDGVPQDTSNTAKQEIVVAAASDLTKAFTEVGARFEELNDCKVTFSFGSTGVLGEQIANGAPFDVFAAANESVIEDLDAKNRIISDTKQLYALGRIGVTTKKDSAIEAATLEDLLKPEIIKVAIANPDHAPYGLAAKQALITAGLWETLTPKMVYGKNISETLTFVTTGNAEVGIIARSLNDEDELHFSLIDETLHEPLKQAMAVINTTENEELARKFVAYVNSVEGKEIMSSYGFVVPVE